MGHTDATQQPLSRSGDMLPPPPPLPPLALLDVDEDDCMSGVVFGVGFISAVVWFLIFFLSIFVSHISVLYFFLFLLVYVVIDVC